MMVAKGMFLMSVRKDGEEISGTVESVRTLPKGTLVVVRSMLTGQPVYASVYLENTRWYRACSMDAPNTVLAAYDSDIPSLVG